MREIGIVETGTRTGLFVLRCSRALRPGTEVYTGDGLRIGRVVRTFGPEKAPYVTVRPEPEADIISLLSKKAYIKGDKNGKKEGRSRNKGRSGKVSGMRKHPHSKGLPARRTHM